MYLIIVEAIIATRILINTIKHKQTCYIVSRMPVVVSKKYIDLRYSSSNWQYIYARQVHEKKTFRLFSLQRYQPNGKSYEWEKNENEKKNKNKIEQ